MDWMNQIGGLLQQYTGGAAPGNAHDDFDQVARHAPPQALSQGLAGAFRSSQTAPFGSMVAQMFAGASGPQRAGILNTLIAAAGPTVMAQMMNRPGNAVPPAATPALNSVAQGQPAQLTVEQATQMPATFVEEVATHAEQQDPSIIDRVSDFYSEQPELVKALGAGALVVLLAKMAQR
jgi:hypothetical protein